MSELIERVDIVEYEFACQDVAPDPYGNIVYQPGGSAAVRRFAIKVATESGVVGEYCPVWSHTHEAIGFTLGFAPRLLGMDIMAREAIFDAAKRAHRKSDHIGFGAIDIAIWDALGKLTGLSIAELLGIYTDRLPAYASTLTGDLNGGLSTPSDYADFAQECRSAGYRAFKMHGVGGNTPMEEAAIVSALGDAVGNEMVLMNDSGSHLRTFADALLVGRACDDAGFFWFEDPMRDSSVSQFAHKRLREMIATPLLITEHVRGVEPKADFAIAGGTDFLRADPELDMGITGTMKIARLAEALGMDVELHAAGPAQRQCMASIRNTNYYEVTLLHPVVGNPVLPPVYACDYSDELDCVDADGNVPLPAGPGLGVTYDWEFIEAHVLHHHVIA